jgi:hypothetical protein
MTQKPSLWVEVVRMLKSHTKIWAGFLSKWFVCVISDL